MYDFQVCYIMVLEHGFNTKPGSTQHKTATENNKLTRILFLLKFSYIAKRNTNIFYRKQRRCEYVCRRGTSPRTSFKQ